MCIDLQSRHLVGAGHAREQISSRAWPAPTVSAQRGVSLVELIIFIVIISVGVAGILGVMNLTTAHSADPLIRKQAIAIAESRLEEIELQSASGVSEGFPANPRSAFTKISTYHNPIAAAVTDMSGAAVPAVAGYQVAVKIVDNTTWLPGTTTKEITVTVTDPSGQSIDAVGYRVNYE